MKKAIIFIFILILAAASGIYRALSIPEWVKVNHAEVQRCTAAMINNPKLLCD